MSKPLRSVQFENNVISCDKPAFDTMIVLLQWNPINTTTAGPKYFGRINEVVDKKNTLILCCSGDKMWSY